MAFFTAVPEIPTVPATPDLSLPLVSGPVQPLVLFPVRLETRFSPRGDGGADLRVRVYPDPLHVDTHEPELTDQEIVWGRNFWEQMWRAATDDGTAGARGVSSSNVSIPIARRGWRRRSRRSTRPSSRRNRSRRISRFRSRSRFPRRRQRLARGRVRLVRGCCRRAGA